MSGAMWYGAFLLSTVCHEAAHAWSARRLGDETAAKGGQLTLNPVPHLRREPVGMIVVPIASWLIGGWIIGWASAPYGREWARLNPRKAALMALAGPGTNLALAAAAALVIRLGFEWGLFARPFVLGMGNLAASPAGGVAETAAQLLSIMLSLNLLLFAFNLIPVPPLDGSQAPLLVLSASAAERYSAATRSPLLRFGGIIVAWKLIPAILPGLIVGVARVLYS